MRTYVQPVLTRAWGNRVCLLAFAAALLLALAALSAGAEEPGAVPASSAPHRGPPSRDRDVSFFWHSAILEAPPVILR